MPIASPTQHAASGIAEKIQALETVPRQTPIDPKAIGRTIPKAKMRQALSPAVAEKYTQLLGVLEGLSGAVVAFSGGIDSSLVAYIAHQVLGARMVAVTSTSASLPSHDGHLTQTLAQEWGMPHRLIVTNELENPNYLANPTNRCYFCKTTLYHHLSTLIEDQPFSAILNGVNADDVSDFRPGLKAAKEHQVRAPLAECGFNKDDIRMLAFHLGLRNAFKPQSACLSSRVPYGTAISAPLLKQIERAEAGVRSVLEPLGFAQLRVRHHGLLGRIELENSALPTALKHHAKLASAVLDAGYTVAGLDLNGFYSGALNSVWRKAQTTPPAPSQQQRMAKANRALQTLGLVHTTAHNHGWVVGLNVEAKQTKQQQVELAALVKNTHNITQAMQKTGFFAVALQIGMRHG